MRKQKKRKKQKREREIGKRIKKKSQAQVAEPPCLVTGNNPCAPHPQLGQGLLHDSVPHVLNCFEKHDLDSKHILINICKVIQENGWADGDLQAVFCE